MRRIKPIRLKAGMTVDSLARELGRAGVIGAGRVAKAVEIIAEMFSDESYTIFLSLSGPLVPAGLRLIISDLIRKGYIDALVTSGANLVHDLIEAMGGEHHSGSPEADDERLREKGVSRAYDIYIESRVFQELERFLYGILDEIPEEKRRETPIWGLLREIGLRLRDEDSILRCAALRDVPIFSPALLDSMIGIPLWMYSKRRMLSINPLRDFEHFAKLVYDAEKASHHPRRRSSEASHTIHEHLEGRPRRGGSDNHRES